MAVLDQCVNPLSPCCLALHKASTQRLPSLFYVYCFEHRDIQDTDAFCQLVFFNVSVKSGVGHAGVATGGGEREGMQIRGEGKESSHQSFLPGSGRSLPSDRHISVKLH